ncbi:MAG: endonuclease domain-containing protein [Betaproteobacteria bacterium]|nr:endonuclease domain-containing protein [Betaproteobacteria bacterium]
MLPYRSDLKQTARKLRTNMTDAERLLWSRLRGKQILGVQFYRQKPVGCYIVDFHAPAAKLVVEVDGSQHFEVSEQLKDRKRDAYLESLNLQVLRFDNLQVMKETEAVLETIYGVVEVRMKSPLAPLFPRGEL